MKFSVKSDFVLNLFMNCGKNDVRVLYLEGRYRDEQKE